MTAPGFDAEPGTIHDAAGPMVAAESTLATFGDALVQAAGTAAGGAGDGPLAGAVEAFGDDGQARAKERGRECRELSQALHDTADEYQARDGQAAAALDSVPFGG